MLLFCLKPSSPFPFHKKIKAEFFYSDLRGPASSGSSLLTGLMPCPSVLCSFCSYRSGLLHAWACQICSTPAPLILFLPSPGMLFRMSACCCLTTSKSDQVLLFCWGPSQPFYINDIHLTLCFPLTALFLFVAFITIWHFIYF